jgi:hypothetical protein
MHPHVLRDNPFGLTFSDTIPGPYTVIFRVYGDGANRQGIMTSYVGIGGTPKAAYEDLLLNTAVILSRHGYR